MGVGEITGIRRRVEELAVLIMRGDEDVDELTATFPVLNELVGGEITADADIERICRSCCLWLIAFLSEMSGDEDEEEEDAERLS